MTPSKQAMDRAKEIMAGAIPAWNVLQHLGETTTLQRDIAAALDATKLYLPSEEEMLDANAKYMKANKSWRNTTDDLDHAYFHGQKDLIEDYLTAQPGVEDEK